MKRTNLLLLLLMVPFMVLNAQTMPDGEVEQMSGFARAVDITDGNIFIGEPANYHQPGAVYIFGAAGEDWAQKSKVMASDGSIGDGFGSSISADANRVLIGAPQANNRYGSAYIFERESSGEWVETGMFALPDDTAGSAVGAAVALSGNLAFIGAPRHAGSQGAVLVYKRSVEGDWLQMTTLSSADTSDTYFGASLATDGTTLTILASRGEGQVVHVFEKDAESWTKAGELTAQTQRRSQFGTSLAIHGDQILVGAPRNGNGTVFVYSMEDGEWELTSELTAFDGQSRYRFGSSVTVTDGDVWVGAPNADGGKGTIYKFHSDEKGMWTGSSKMITDIQDAGDSFGATLAIEANTAVVGMTGTDYGSGSAAILSKAASGEWMAEKVLIGTSEEVLQPITGGQVNCSEARADRFGCENVDLISFLPISAIGGERGVRLNDIWGWTDPETGKEYALVGRNEGTSFVDISDADNPVYVANLPMTEGARANVWRDIKVYKSHAYIVADGAGEHGMQVLDLTQLRDFKSEPLQLEETALYTNIHSAHNVVINEETGYAYIVGSSGGGNTCGGGLHMVNIQDPANPVFEGCFSDPSTGRSGTGYSHDAQCVVYNGPDEEHQGSEICFGANETAVSIADVTDKKNPVALSTASYPNYGYVHQGWLTEDHKYFFQNDELDELTGNVENTRTMVWDVTDLDDPQLVTEFYIDIPSSDHNLYIKDGRMYQSNYVSGLQVIDVSDPANPKKVGEFDTDPFSNTAPGFSGTWSNYPFFESGTIIMTSGREGLFMLKTNEAINQ